MSTDLGPASGCGAVVDGTSCPEPSLLDAPVNLCPHHFRVAADWMAESVGVTDLLPAPCVSCGSRIGVRYPSGWICSICEWRHGEVPDGVAGPPRVDVVYYLRLDERIKIGTTANPRQRFSALRHDEVLAFERGNRTLEQRRHAQFAEHRLATSEWFTAADALLAHIDVARGGIDPWATLARWRSERVALG